MQEPNKKVTIRVVLDQMEAVAILIYDSMIPSVRTYLETICIEELRTEWTWSHGAMMAINKSSADSMGQIPFLADKA